MKKQEESELGDIMKEIMAQVEYDIKRNVDWFVDEYMKSVFREGGDEGLKECLTRMFKDCAERSDHVVERKISKQLYENPLYCMKRVFEEWNVRTGKYKMINIDVEDMTSEKQKAMFGSAKGSAAAKKMKIDGHL